MRIRDSFSGTRTSAASALLSLAVVVSPGPALITAERALLNKTPAGVTGLAGVIRENRAASPIDGARALLNRPEDALVTTRATAPSSVSGVPAVDGRRALLGTADAGPMETGTAPRH